METIPFTKDDIKKYLDSCITIWRKFRDDSRNNKEVRGHARCYVDAFQSVRSSLFGNILPKKEK